jgi:rfaE bifunctional protein nucleotidyltransferase chain/domain/rfaE bifunctional protein kinase chain/domain
VSGSRPRRLVVVGDLLLDRAVLGRSDRLCPDAPVPVVDVEETRDSPGGAGLTALMCAGDGVQVTLVAPVADDDAGRTLLRMLADAGVRVLPLGHTGGTRRKIRVRSQGQSLLRLDDGGPGHPAGELPAAVADALADADVVLVSDYGAGTADHPQLRELLTGPARRGALCWDPHPRGAAPVPGCALVTPNRAEAAAVVGGRPDEAAAALRERWRARAVCVTTGADGAWLVTGAGEPVYVPAPPVSGGDPCGAGDRFAAAAAVALARGAVLSEAVGTAVTEASAWVARDLGAPPACGGAIPRDHAIPPTDAFGLAARIRAAGGTLVATGGCFDVLHAGHVACLEAARRLGDGLVVLLNSDDSVRRLKGPGRPVQPQDDRARVLRGLESVDAVLVFDEDDPQAALGRLRPDVWAKGGDYGGAPLPEADLIRSWGGRVVLLPYLAGRSTTAILEEVR